MRKNHTQTYNNNHIIKAYFYYYVGTNIMRGKKKLNRDSINSISVLFIIMHGVEEEIWVEIFYS